MLQLNPLLVKEEPADWGLLPLTIDIVAVRLRSDLRAGLVRADRGVVIAGSRAKAIKRDDTIIGNVEG